MADLERQSCFLALQPPLKLVGQQREKDSSEQFSSSSQHWEMITGEGTKSAEKSVAEEPMQGFLEELKDLGTRPTTCSSRTWARKFCLNSWTNSQKTSPLLLMLKILSPEQENALFLEQSVAG